MPTFHLPLPPSVNHAYQLGNRHIFKSAELVAWEQEAALIVKGWTPPARHELGVQIDLSVPRRLFRKADIDGYVKPILDAVVGSRRDCWIVELAVLKMATDGPGEARVDVW